MKMIKLYFLIISAIVIAGHQAARLIIFPFTADHGGLIKVTPFFNLVEVWNHGISFGMFRELAYGQWLLSGVSLIIVVLFLFMLRKTQDRVSIVAYSLIIGGAIGNVFDRLRFGAVADYLDFHLFDYHWPAFNVTDMAIVSGVFLLLIIQALPRKTQENSTQAAHPNEDPLSNIERKTL